MIADPQDAAALAKREDRLLFINFAAGAAAIALALESWHLGAGALATTLAAAFVRPRRLAASPQVEGLLGVAGALAGLPLALSEQSAAPGLALFLLVAQAVKLSAPRAPRDASLGLVIGVVLAGVSASEGVTPLFGVLLLANVATGLWLAALRTRRRLVEGAALTRAVVLTPATRATRTAGQAAAHRAATTVAGGARALVPIIGATVLLFGLFPRVGMHFLPSQKESRERLAGFTDVVGLEDMGQIQQNESIAFRAELVAGTLPAAPYWRGRAMDLYDGETWQTSRTFGLAGTRLDQEGPDGLKDPLLDAPANAPLADVVIYQEPFNTRCLFVAGAMRALQFKTARPQVIDRDALGAIVCFRAPLVPIAYRTLLHPTHEVPQFHQPLLTRGRIRDHCLRLPPEVDVALLGDYARRALAARGVPPDAPASVVARTLEDHLATTYTYTLDSRRTPGTEPVADFLFRLRRGHCEYFASALAVLLRTVGIPSRLVSGFHGGDWSSWSRTWTVRQRNAHAWVEAETERGWARFDPTPERDLASGSSAFAEAATAVGDWLELRWYKWIIAYDAYDQRNLVRRLQEAAVELGEAIRLRLERLTPGVSIPPLAYGVVLLLSGVTLVLGVRGWRRRGIARARRALGGPEAELVADLLATLARRGVERGEHETLRELVARARAELGPDADPLVAWIPAYQAARFGGRDVDAAASAGARRALDVLRATAPRPSPASV